MPRITLGPSLFNCLPGRHLLLFPLLTSSPRPYYRLTAHEAGSLARFHYLQNQNQQEPCSLFWATPTVPGTPACTPAQRAMTHARGEGRAKRGDVIRRLEAAVSSGPSRHSVSSFSTSLIFRRLRTRGRGPQAPLPGWCTLIPSHQPRPDRVHWALPRQRLKAVGGPGAPLLTHMPRAASPQDSPPAPTRNWGERNRERAGWGSMPGTSTPAPRSP